MCNRELKLLKSKLVKKNIKYAEIPRCEACRIGLCNELLLIRDDEECYVPGFDSDELDCLVRYLCVIYFSTIIPSKTMYLTTVSVYDIINK